jgi:hypothetical protein
MLFTSESVTEGHVRADDVDDLGTPSFAPGVPSKRGRLPWEVEIGRQSSARL